MFNYGQQPQVQQNIGTIKLTDLQNKTLILGLYNDIDREHKLSKQIDEDLKEEKKLLEEIDSLMGPIATVCYLFLTNFW